MPELPEVEAVKMGLESTILGLSIDQVEVLWSRIIAEPEDVEEFKELLKDQTFEKIERRGKFLIFYLSDYALISHLRMEGKYFLHDKNEARDKHTHVIFSLDNNQELRYLDVRKFGRMSLVSKTQVSDHKSLVKLGPEPDSPAFSESYIKEFLKNKTKAIKTILLDQSLVAGVGNIYADEILFQAKIHPVNPGRSLTDLQIKHLRDATRDIIRRAILAGGSTIRTYTNTFGQNGSYQDQHQVYMKTGQPCPDCGGQIEKIQLNGRGTHFCSQCQILNYQQIVLGLTGGIASGKSTISQMFMDAKIPLVDSDLIARQVVEKGSPGLKQIIQEFGREVLADDGSLDRKKLGSIVFADEEKRQALNQITHPLIQRESSRQKNDYLKQGAWLVVLDIPLLFEIASDKKVDQTLVVYVDSATQIKRLMARDRFTKEEAQRRIDAQASLEEKREKADLVIDNSGTLEASREQFQNVLSKLKNLSESQQ